MPGKLIINADDFGLTTGVNRAIGELAESGALTSATLMANGTAFNDAVRIASGIPALGVGCHVVLTDGTPVSSPKSIPSLIGPDGRSFRASLKSFWMAVLSGRVSPADIEQESVAQIAKLQSAGIRVTHVDTHKHTHMLPAVARPVLRAAEKLGVGAIRNPFEHAWSLRLSRGNLQRTFQVSLLTRLRRRFMSLPQIQRGVVVTTDGTIGISATGDLDAKVIDKLLQNLPSGVWELVCHPGYHDSELDQIKTRLRETREIEREALLGAFTESSSHRSAAELIHYGMLSSRSGLNTANHYDSSPTSESSADERSS